MFSWSIPNKLVALSFSRPRSAVSKCFHIPAIVTVVYRCPLSDDWPHSIVESILIKAFLQLWLYWKERLPDSGRPGHVDVVIGSPQPRQYQRRMKRSVCQMSMVFLHLVSFFFLLSWNFNLLLRSRPMYVSWLSILIQPCLWSMITMP